MRGREGENEIYFYISIEMKFSVANNLLLLNFPYFMMVRKKREIFFPVC